MASEDLPLAVGPAMTTRGARAVLMRGTRNRQMRHRRSSCTENFMQEEGNIADCSESHDDAEDDEHTQGVSCFRLSIQNRHCRHFTRLNVATAWLLLFEFASLGVVEETDTQGEIGAVELMRQWRERV
jgi:hypothetical protein